MATLGEIPGVSGIIASPPTKEAPAPAFPKPAENPPESPLDKFIQRRIETERKKANAPKGWKGFAANLWGNALVRFGLVGGAIAAGGIAVDKLYQDVPAIHSTVDSLTGRGIPETFDNNADSIIAKGSVNAIPATNEKILSIINTTVPPLEKGKLPTIRMLLPPLKPGETIEISRFYRNDDFNTITDKLERLEWGRTLTFAKKGTNIPIPIMEGVSHVELFKEKGSNPEDEIYPWSYSLKFQVNGQDNVSYILAIVADYPTHISPKDIIKDAPVLGPRDNPILTELKGLKLSVEELQSIWTTNSDNVRIHFLIAAFPLEYPRGLATKIEFITDFASGKGLNQ